MSDGREGFLARWSRRKAGIATPDAPSAPAASTAPSSPAATAAPTIAATADVARAPAGAAADAAAEAAAHDALPLPTLADVAALTRESDYARFMAPGVDSAVRNAAMKKLFSDPRFNVMDGLDVYIDDYAKPDPLPLATLRKLRQSELLGLFRDDPPSAVPPAGAAPLASPDNAGADAVAAAPASAPATLPPAPATEARPRAEDDPDLRLQPLDGDRRPGAGEGPRG